MDKAAELLPDATEDIPLGLLIGGNCKKALEPLETTLSRECGPYAHRTRLGWCVVGPAGIPSEDCDTPIRCNFINVKTAKFHVNDAISGQPSSHHFTTECHVSDRTITNKLQNMYDMEFCEVNPEKKGLSREDDKFLKIVQNGICMSEGHFEVPLPFRDDKPYLPNNRAQALYRLGCLKRRMQRDYKYRKDYTSFMNGLVEKGYAQKCSRQIVDGKTWYIPHHGVYQPPKPKIRGVLDCSSRFHGTSLNDILLQGRDLANQMV